MTNVSAASLPGRGQEAPFPSFRSYRRDGCLQTASAPLKLVPKVALSDDPPRGRILVVADAASLVLDVQRMLRDAGFRAVGPASSTGEIRQLIRQRPIDGAIIDLELPNASAVADSLAAQRIPFVWLTDGSAALPRLHEGAPVVNTPVTSEALIQAIERALSSEQPVVAESFYPVPPPQQVWPRVFPQL